MVIDEHLLQRHNHKESRPRGRVCGNDVLIESHTVLVDSMPIDVLIPEWRTFVGMRETVGASPVICEYPTANW
jgi:hypothetical protein